MTGEIVSEGTTLLKAFDSCSLIEKVVGKRQSIIFALCIMVLLLAYMGQKEIGAAIVGYLGLLIKDYIDDVGAEKQP